MSYEQRPDFSKVWASKGSVAVPSDQKIETGWEKEIPPFEYFNFLANDMDKKFKYFAERGISEWSTVTEYPRNALVQYRSKYYRALKANVGVEPSESITWTTTIMDVRFCNIEEVLAGTSENTVVSPYSLSKLVGTTTRKGLVRFSSDSEATLGVSQDCAVTPKQVNSIITASVNPLIEEFLDISEPIGIIKKEFTSQGFDSRYVPLEGQSIDSLSGYPRLQAYMTSRGMTNLPDFRGVFSRGWDNGRGLDSGRTLGSYQADNIKSHSHSGSVGHTDLGTKTTSSNGGGYKLSFSGSTTEAGAHNHDLDFEMDANEFHEPASTLGGGQDGRNDNKVKTRSVGNHTHNFSGFTSEVRNHTHDITLGSHFHNLTIDAFGGTETTVKNVSVIICTRGR